ncbi:hypothetical protein [Paenibacillus thiaminolyticus]|uniref:hypothetical protein n=1 Tax=Paenibacillus thiaminolyticus TaxID=49283 RepID=UPI0025439D5D|nr:hypothetical protein [Paenibacillus thiaminolyticus]WII37167.1 hypothetical protein O0V01_26865 [Paenibacillus thiaminolyticus]
MHVDWNWIKQRPHFLYEELTQYFQVDLFYIRKLYYRHGNRIRNARNIKSDSAVNTLKKLPLSGRFRKLQWIERIINRGSICSLKHYDYVWITSPLILEFVPIDKIEDKMVFYDCMDDFLGFYKETKEIERLQTLEIALVQRADIVFSSSTYLKNKIVSSYQSYLKSKPIVINNGISSDLFHQKPATTINKQVSKKDKLELLYIGTIDEWIDFQLIINILNHIPNVVFTMIGPVNTKVPSHSRLNFGGVVEHNKLANYANVADALVMPFKLNELTRAVDPVKIYEYIHFNKPIFAINYEEMHKFQPFVSLYSDEAELYKLILHLQNGSFKMYSEDEAKDFLSTSTWGVRCKQIVDVLKGAR